MFIKITQNGCFVHISPVDNVYKVVSNSCLCFLHVDKFVNFNSRIFPSYLLTTRFYYTFYTYIASYGHYWRIDGFILFFYGILT